MSKEGLGDVYDFVDELKKKKIPMPEAEEQLKKFYNRKKYDRGITLYNSLDKNYRIWGKINVSWPNSNSEGPRYEVYHPKTGSPVKVPERGWRWKNDTFKELVDYEKSEELHDGSFMCGRIWFAKDENTQPSSIKYLDEVNDFLLRSILSLKSSGGIEAEKYLRKNVFSYPKPKQLIKTLIKSNISEGDIVMDFFAGSSTLAHAVIEINEETNLGLNFIQVQLPEKLEKDNKDHKVAYQFCIDNNLKTNLFEISKKRLKGVISEVNNKSGFKVFKLQSTNYKAWQNYKGTIVEELEKTLDLFNQSPLREGWTEAGLLTEAVLLEGFTLDSTIKELEQYSVNNLRKVTSEYCEHALIVCLDEEIKEETIQALELKGNDIFICLDSAISNVDKLRLSDKGLIKTI